MDRKQFEMKYNFVPVFDTKMKKRRSIAPHLAKDPNYLLKMGFELIEGPPIENTNKYFIDGVPVDPPKVASIVYANGIPGVLVGEDMPLATVPPELIGAELKSITIEEVKPKRGRPKKQS